MKELKQNLKKDIQICNEKLKDLLAHLEKVNQYWENVSLDEASYHSFVKEMEADADFMAINEEQEALAKTLFEVLCSGLNGE